MLAIKLNRAIFLALPMVFCFLTPLPSFGGAPAPPPPFIYRFAAADSVIVGVVKAVEKHTVTLPSKEEYRIIVVKIDDPIWGAKGLTEVRVGYTLFKQIDDEHGAKLPRLDPAVGVKACFFLSKRPDADFYMLSNPSDFVDHREVDFVPASDFARSAAKLLENDSASLKSENAQTRYLTAAVLILRYRYNRNRDIPNKTKQEPIDPGLSKMILETLRSADWTPAPKEPQTAPSSSVDAALRATATLFAKRNGSAVSPGVLFNNLGLTAADGWNPERFSDYKKEFPAAAQKWLKEHAGTYRIQRFVVEIPPRK